jgi:hypothetical protein
VSTAFIVMGYTQYENSDPIRVFEVESDAQEFAAKCTAHEKRRPELPDIDDEVAWELAEARQQRWLERHPAGDNSHQTYSVIQIPYVKGTA